MDWKAQRGISLAPRSHSKGRRWIEEGDLDGQASLHFLLGVLGSLGLGCLRELKGKERGLSGLCGGGAASRKAGRSLAPAPPIAGKVMQRKHASQSPPGRCPMAPKSKMSHERLVSRWQMLCGSRC